MVRARSQVVLDPGTCIVSIDYDHATWDAVSQGSLTIAHVHVPCQECSCNMESSMLDHPHLCEGVYTLIEHAAGRSFHRDRVGHQICECSACACHEGEDATGGVVKGVNGDH